MVSRKQLVLMLAVAPVFAQPRFYEDDPLTREPVPHPVKELVTRKVDDVYSFFENSYVTPRREGREARHAPQRALDVNTLGEVPDSAWYTNRHASHRMTIEELRKGPGDSSAPAPGAWTVIAAKNEGVTPSLLAPTIFQESPGLGGVEFPGPRSNSAIDMRRNAWRLVYQALSGTSPRVFTSSARCGARRASLPSRRGVT